MRYLHTMVRARDLDATLEFYCDKLGLVEIRRYDSEAGRFTLVFLRWWRSPGTGIPRTTTAGAISATWRTASTISTHYANA